MYIFDLDSHFYWYPRSLALLDAFCNKECCGFITPSSPARHCWHDLQFTTSLKSVFHPLFPQEWLCIMLLILRVLLGYKYKFRSTIIKLPIVFPRQLQRNYPRGNSWVPVIAEVMILKLDPVRVSLVHTFVSVFGKPSASSFSEWLVFARKDQWIFLDM